MPLEHVISSTQMIGIDFADVKEVLCEGPMNSSRFCIENLSSWFEKAGRPAASVAFSSEDRLLELDNAINIIRDVSAEDLIWQGNAAVPCGQCHALARLPERLVPRSAPVGMNIERFRKFRSFAQATRTETGRNYCEPFVPFVGDRYGDGEMPRVMYCGVAGAWSEHDGDLRNDEDLFAASQLWTTAFALSGGNASSFWTFLDDVLLAVDSDKTRSALERRRRTIWTNLSKLGLVSETAPPQGDHQLRAIDVEQLQHEIALWKPDLLMCVSGGSLIPTGNAAFADCFKADFAPTNQDGTVVCRLPTGGLLYWTMHPQFKSVGWRENGLRDIAELMNMQGREN